MSRGIPTPFVTGLHERVPCPGFGSNLLAISVNDLGSSNAGSKVGCPVATSILLADIAPFDKFFGFHNTDHFNEVH
ncbi:unnamed protein product [Phytophthora fragariaefolia]|uniref:Unnamed protein product n=1 Tax=Phytophthora fragariaefolia TaxID=1490495 RepID=A0A9W6U819_9STRA|nr:unnamed protein product [Phytophthora fragariaefolia]